MKLFLEHIYIFLLILLFVFTAFPKQASAQVVASNCVLTKVGDPADKPVLPPECSIRKKFVYYCQNDYKYCDIDGSGCGPTSVAMIVSTFGTKITPPQVSDILLKGGYRSCGRGSNLAAALSGYLREQGFTHIQLLSNKPLLFRFPLIPRPALNLQKAKNYIDNGYLIIGSTQGHIFVVDDVNPAANQVHMQDPAGPGCRTPGRAGYWTSNKFPWLGHSWYYAYAVKKIK